MDAWKGTERYRIDFPLFGPQYILARRCELILSLVAGIYCAEGNNFRHSTSFLGKDIKRHFRLKLDLFYLSESVVRRAGAYLAACRRLRCRPGQVVQKRRCAVHSCCHSRW
jgi:hypothetical protein